MSTSAAADTRATAAARAAAAPRAPPPPPPPRAGLQSLSPDLARLLAGHLRGEEGSLAATCRLFRDAARSTRGPAGSVVARLDADLQAVSGVLARVPGVTSLTLTLRLDPGRAANLHFLAAARVTALDLRREGGAPPARALALLARGFPALRELSVEAPPGRARRSAPPPLAALRELGALTALTLLNVHEDAGLEAVTTLRRLTLELTDHGDVALERCPACGEAHETEEVEFSERVRAWEAAPPTRVGAALCSLPLLEELLVDFGGGGGVAGAAAARNCLVGFGAAGGGAPGWAALREIQLRDLGDGDSYVSAAPGAALGWRAPGALVGLWRAAPALERASAHWSSSGGGGEEHSEDEFEFATVKAPGGGDVEVAWSYEFCGCCDAWTIDVERCGAEL